MKFRILPIAGDASFRTFYRLIQKKNRKIIVFAKKEKYKNLIAYSAINNFLRINKILTPKVYAHNYSKGIIVIEDFGDVSFYKTLLKNTSDTLKYCCKHSTHYFQVCPICGWQISGISRDSPLLFDLKRLRGESRKP